MRVRLGYGNAAAAAAAQAQRSVYCCVHSGEREAEVRKDRLGSSRHKLRGIWDMRYPFSMTGSFVGPFSVVGSFVGLGVSCCRVSCSCERRFSSSLHKCAIGSEERKRPAVTAKLATTGSERKTR